MATLSIAQDEGQHPLKPVATTSPRATLTSFQTLMDDVCQRAQNSNSARAVLDPLNDAVRCLDVSQLSPINAEDQSFEAALMLKEILDRIELPQMESIPGDNEVKRSGQQQTVLQLLESWQTLRSGGGNESTLSPLVETDIWVLPNTEITIARMVQGPRRGEFLFTAETIARIPEFYERIKDLPYRTEVRPNLYRAYIATPGRGISLRWKDRVPDWATRIVGGQTVWQWILTLLLIPIAATLILLALRRGVWRDSTHLFVGRMGTIAALIASLGIISLTGWLLDEAINLTGAPLRIVSSVVLCAWYGILVWLTYTLLTTCGELVIRMKRYDPKGARGKLTRLIAHVLAISAGILMLVYGANQLGLPAYSIVAGLGVGGFAAALASQDGLKGLVGSLIIMAERPYSAGDWVILGDHQGNVDEIGYRCTRIRTFYDSVVSIPNAEIANMTVDNMGRRNYRRVYAKIGIADQAPEKVEAFLEGTKRIIQANQYTRKDNFHVVLHGFSDSGLNVMLYFFLDVPTWAMELVERQRIFLELIRLADALDVKFAPTQSLVVETTSSENPSQQSEVDEEELARIARAFGDGQLGRPTGSGIFVPPYEEPGQDNVEPQ